MYYMNLKSAKTLLLLVWTLLHPIRLTEIYHWPRVVTGRKGSLLLVALGRTYWIDRRRMSETCIMHVRTRALFAPLFCTWHV